MGKCRRVWYVSKDDIEGLAETKEQKEWWGVQSTNMTRGSLEVFYGSMYARRTSFAFTKSTKWLDE